MTKNQELNTSITSNQDKSLDEEMIDQMDEKHMSDETLLSVLNHQRRQTTRANMRCENLELNNKQQKTQIELLDKKCTESEIKFMQIVGLVGDVNHAKNLFDVNKQLKTELAKKK